MKEEYKEVLIKRSLLTDAPIRQYFLHVSKLVNEVEGSFVETGFGEGVSANIFVELMNQNLITKRDIWLYDSFEGFPEPSPEDKSPRNPRKGEWRRPIEPALEMKNKIDTNVHVIKGFFEDTIPDSYTDKEIAILHLDCDLYNSYKVCLEGLYEKVVPGGLILFDEYKSPQQLKSFPGASKAIDSFFEKIDIQLTKAQFDPETCEGWESKQKYFTIKPH